MMILLTFLAGLWFGFWLATGWERIRRADRWVTYQNATRDLADRNQKDTEPLEEGRREPAGPARVAADVLVEL